jgi:hypothetical protein
LRWLRSESHQTPIGIKRVASVARCRPGGIHHPRKTLVPTRVHRFDHIRMVASDGTSPERAHQLGDSFLPDRSRHKHDVQSFAMVVISLLL